MGRRRFARLTNGCSKKVENYIIKTLIHVKRTYDYGSSFIAERHEVK